MTLVQQSIPKIDLALVPESIRPQVAMLIALVEKLTSENSRLRANLDAFIRKHFGNQKNEGLSEAQLELALQEFVNQAVQPPVADAASEVEPKQKKKTVRKPVRQRLPENLPLRSEQILIPEEVQKQPDAWRKIDETVTDILDYEPGRLVRDRLIRPRYVRVEEMDAPAAVVVAAALPNRIIEKGMPGPGLLTHLVIERFQNHLPYYRQQQTFEQRHLFPLSRQTISEWVEEVARWFVPVVEQMRSELLASKYIQVDETPIRYLDRSETGKSQTGYLWAYLQPKGDVIFDWRTGRGRDGPEEFLKGFKGFLQSDGYGAYVSLGESNPDLELCHCVTHWRRKFIEAKDEDRRSLWFLRQLKSLYKTEERLRDMGAGPALREALRASESKMIWARLEKAMKVLENRVLPQSLLGKALAYGRNQWTGLIRHLESGLVEIDTNLVENSIRPTAIGKKNFLFVGHPEAGWKSAVLYSIIGSCRRRQINAEMYIKDMLVRLPDMKQSELKEYTPAAWIKRNPQAQTRPTR